MSDEIDTTYTLKAIESALAERDAEIRRLKEEAAGNKEAYILATNNGLKGAAILAEHAKLKEKIKYLEQFEFRVGKTAKENSDLRIENAALKEDIKNACDFADAQRARANEYLEQLMAVRVENAKLKNEAIALTIRTQVLEATGASEEVYTRLKEQLEIAKQGLEFYADRETWKARPQIDDFDSDGMTSQQYGRRARETLAKLGGTDEST